MSVAISYALAGLQADTPYEVLVSYPGTIPVDVRVRFSRKQRSGTAGRCVWMLHAWNEQDSECLCQHVRSRKLLDTEKLEFRTDAAAGLAVANWELVFEELGVLGIMSSVASRLLSYDSLDELLDDVASTASGAAKAAVSATTTVAGAVGQAASAAASAKAGGAAPVETKEESA